MNHDKLLGAIDLTEELRATQHEIDVLTKVIASAVQQDSQCIVALAAQTPTPDASRIVFNEDGDMIRYHMPEYGPHGTPLRPNDPRPQPPPRHNTVEYSARISEATTLRIAQVILDELKKKREVLVRRIQNITA